MQTDALAGGAEPLRRERFVEPVLARGLDAFVERVGDAPEGERLVGAVLGEGEVEVWGLEGAGGMLGGGWEDGGRGLTGGGRWIGDGRGWEGG